jgi:hypothetical protein
LKNLRDNGYSASVVPEEMKKAKEDGEGSERPTSNAQVKQEGDRGERDFGL